MVTATQPLTVSEYSQLPDEIASEYSELHGGEVVNLTKPKFEHFRVQRNLRILLDKSIGPDYLAEIEFAFRPLEEYEMRIADVALVTVERYEETRLDDYFQGSPELVVEVLSPSNRASEMYERENLSLENGGVEFWVIDSDRRQIKVFTPDARFVTYKAGQQIPLTSFGGTSIRVDDIFRF